MAKINPVKLKQEAEQFEKAGRLDQAIGKYREIVNDNPRDWNTVKKIGDLYVRLNRYREAIVEYEKLADFYAKDGFLLKAIAIWKQIQKLDASALEPYTHLAELYAKQGLMMEAKSQYQIVVDEFLKRGRTREAGDILKKMADIDPGDLKIRSRLADLYTRDGNAPRAVEEHVAIAEELGKKGHLAEAIQVLEKGLKLDPSSYRLRAELARVHMVQKNYDRAIQFLEEAVQIAPSDPPVLAALGEAYLGARKLEEAEATFKRLLEINPQHDESRVQMARLYLGQNDFDSAYEHMAAVVARALAARDTERAISLLQQVVQRNPHHVRTLEKLVEIYRELRRETALVAAASQLTEAYIGDGRFDRAAVVLEELVEREPSNQQHRTKLEFVRSRLPAEVRSTPSPGAAPPSAPGALLGGEILEEEFELTAGDEPAAAPPPRPASASSPPLMAPVRVEISGPLSEDDREFIEEHLAEGKVFRKYGLTDKAVDQFEAVVARFPDNVEARQELRELYREKGMPGKAAEQSRALAEILRVRGDEAAASDHEEDARRAQATVPPPPAPARPTAAAVPPPRPAPPAPSPPPPAEEEEEISIDVEDTGFEVEEAVPVAVAEPPAEFSLEDDSVEELPVRFLEEEDIFSIPVEEEPPAAPPPGPPALPSPVVARSMPSAGDARADVPPELRRTLDEVEQYVSLGFVDDARDAVRELAHRHREHPGLLARIAELGLELPAEPVAQAAPTAPAPSPPPAPAVSSATEELDVEVDLREEEPLLVEAASDPLLELELDAPPLLPPLEEEPVPVEIETSPAEDLLGLDTEAEEAPLTVPLEETITSAPPPEMELEIEAPGGPPSPLEIEEEEPEEPAVEPSSPFEVETSFELELEEPEPVAVAVAVEAAGAGLELGDELGELFGMQQAVEASPPLEAATIFEDSGLADIFKEFKKGVDKQLGKEDYDTRYNLGIAYKEMGLLDEAIAEFQLAARDETRLLECSSMLGICFMEKGMPKLAVKWFEKGLAVPGRNEEEYQGLRYDLAIAYAAGGDQDHALSIFTELYGQNANFRDVAAKVRELSAGRP